MLFVVRQLTVFGVWLDSFSFGCLNVGVYLSSFFQTFAPCLEHVCAGGGGVV